MTRDWRAGNNCSCSLPSIIRVKFGTGSIEMKLRMLAFITIMAMSVSGTANASSKAQRLYTGEDMLAQCAGKPPPRAPVSDVTESEAVIYKGICIGYLSGVFDTHGTYVGRGMPKTFCKPKRRGTIPDLSLTEVLVEFFIEYVNEKPERLPLTAGSLAINAFANAFPCE